MKRHFFCLAILFACAAPAKIVFSAENSDPPPLEARKDGAIAGDPRGAMRALGGNADNGFKPDDNKVDVPKLGGNVGANHTGGPPPGVSSGR